MGVRSIINRLSNLFKDAQKGSSEKAKAGAGWIPIGKSPETGIGLLLDPEDPTTHSKTGKQTPKA